MHADRIPFFRKTVVAKDLMMVKGTDDDVRINDASALILGSLQIGLRAFKVIWTLSISSTAVSFSRALSELPSRQRKKDQRRFRPLHKEAGAIFVVRLQELMEEAHLHLSFWACPGRRSIIYTHHHAV
jgi:hypothetical protein